MNWGMRIAIFMTAFIGFILYMVISLSMTKVDLVAEDYYQQELDFEHQITAVSNTENATHRASIKRSENGVQIQFTGLEEDQIPAGKISFFRPNDADKDLVFDLSSLPHVNALYDVASTDFTSGKYRAKLEYDLDGTTYYTSSTIFF